MGQDCELSIIDVRVMDSSLDDALPILKLPMKHSKITSMMWFLDETIITGHENGMVATYDTRVSYNFYHKLITMFMLIFLKLDGTRNKFSKGTHKRHSGYAIVKGHDYVCYGFQGFNS